MPKIVFCETKPFDLIRDRDLSLYAGALVRCFDDGLLALDNDPAETPCAVLPLVARTIYSPAPMPPAAALHSLIENAELNGLIPQHYLADVLDRFADYPARRIAELPPRNAQPLDAARAAA
jgi:hypothetical protein